MRIFQSVIVTKLVMITNSFGIIIKDKNSTNIYLLKENFEQIPDSLYYAAKVDGTSDLKYLLKVMIPMSKPTLVTIAIFIAK